MKTVYGIALGLIVIAVIGIAIDIKRENEYLRVALSRYEIANGKNYGRIQNNKEALKEVAKDYSLHWQILKAIQVHENMGEGLNLGVKKIMPDIKNKYSPDMWQYASASHIIRQEATKYVFKDKETAKEFLKQLGTRYCYWDKNWGVSVYHIYLAEMEKGD